jgi:hypothetical protein
MELMGARAGQGLLGTCDAYTNMVRVCGCDAAWLFILEASGFASCFTTNSAILPYSAIRCMYGGSRRDQQLPPRLQACR